MRWLPFIFYRFLDPSLRRPVRLGAIDSFDSGEWNRRIGEMGEDLARKFMWAHGMKVLYRQYKAKGGGEVDIVAREDDVLVFCEVKTRSSTRFGQPADAVDREKENLIKRGANAWLVELGFEPIYRFDIIEVVLKNGERPHINLIRNAFQSSFDPLA